MLYKNGNENNLTANELESLPAASHGIETRPPARGVWIQALFLPLSTGYFPQPSPGSDLGSSSWRRLPRLQRFFEFRITHGRIPEGQKDLTRKFFTETAVLLLLLVATAIMKRAHARRQLCRPEGAAVDMAAPDIGIDLVGKIIQPARHQDRPLAACRYFHRQGFLSCSPSPVLRVSANRPPDLPLQFPFPFLAGGVPVNAGNRPHRAQIFFRKYACFVQAGGNFPADVFHVRQLFSLLYSLVRIPPSARSPARYPGERHWDPARKNDVVPSLRNEATKRYSRLHPLLRRKPNRHHRLQS